MSYTPSLYVTQMLPARETYFLFFVTTKQKKKKYD